jgi:hypothetical protein
VKLLRSRYLRLLLGVVISLVCIYLASQGVDYGSVWATLAETNGWWLGLAVLSVIVNTCGKAIRWKVLMGETGQRVHFLQALRLILIAQMLNNVIPIRVGDLSRAYLAGELGVSKSFVLGTVALEKVLDMVLYVALFLLLLLSMPVPEWVSKPAYVLIITACASLGVTIFLLWNRLHLVRVLEYLFRLLPNRIASTPSRMVAMIFESLSVLRNQRHNFWLLVWSLVVWGTATLTNYLILQALTMQLPAVSALFVLIVLMAGITLPSVPGRIGLFEYLCVLSLAVFAVDQTRALSYGVLLHAVVFVPPTVAGIVALWSSGKAMPLAQAQQSEP